MGRHKGLVNRDKDNVEEDVWDEVVASTTKEDGSVLKTDLKFKE